MSKPLIAVCIPAYERVDFLLRLLDSIKIQTFTDFEVIITDDSKTDNVENFIKNYQKEFTLHYYRNESSLGSKNWHECIKYADSEWIKMIHDDDWFATKESLQQYANGVSTGTSFIFSGYNSFYEHTGKFINETITQKKFKQIAKSPSLLFARNLIGPPSVLMIHHSMKDFFYDINLKWFIDIEYYLRVFAKGNATYIGLPLVNVSYNDSQITNYTKTNPSVIIPESLYILNKHGKTVTSNILAYDSWWRVFRNMKISTVIEIKKYAVGNAIPPLVNKMLQHQGVIPKAFIRVGIISKCCMAISYFLNDAK